MIRAVMLSFLIAMLTASAAAQQTPGVPETSASTTKVIGQVTEQQIVSLEVGHADGAEVGDPFWIFDGLHVLATGEIYLVEPARSVGRLTEAPAEDLRGHPAVVFHRTSILALCGSFPPGVTVRGIVARAPPGRLTAWLDIGRDAGLQEGDTVLVHRKDIPIARGDVELLEDHTALVALSPLVRNALAQPGDPVALWPAPAAARRGAVNTTVLNVTPDPEGALVDIVGRQADGLALGRLVDIFDDGAYRGVAAVFELGDPLSRARLIEAASVDAPQIGDRAVVRGGPADPPRPLRAVIFRIEEDYCLLAAGETDGVRVGERFVVREPVAGQYGRQQELAELTIATVKVDYSGAEIRLLGGRTEPLSRWTMAERRSPAWPEWVPIGTIEGLEASRRLLTARIEDRAAMIPGQLIRWTPLEAQPPGAAIVLRQVESRLVAWSPHGWGDLRDAPRAWVEASATARFPGARTMPAR